MQQKFERPDFMTNIMQNSSTKGMSTDDIDFTLSILMLAGSEMTATALSATTWFLLNSPDITNKTRKEVQRTFKTDGDIKISTVSNCRFYTWH